MIICANALSESVQTESQIEYDVFGTLEECMINKHGINNETMYWLQVCK